VSAVVQSVSVSTPLPPPDWMEKYKSVNPEIINEILKEFRENGENNRILSRKQISIIGSSQWHGFIATVLILLLAFLSAFFNHEKVALTFLGLSIVGVIQSLIRK
jgi:uncharacterized membrane protein